jgi:hypothetical protein
MQSKLLGGLAFATGLMVFTAEGASADHERAIELLRQRIAEGRPVRMQPATQIPAPAAPAQPAPAATVAPVRPATPPPAQVQAATPAQAAASLPVSREDSPEIRGALEIVRGRIADLRRGDVRPETPAEQANPEPPARTRQQQLVDLLQRYRDGQIGPAQYQAERAVILSQP